MTTQVRRVAAFCLMLFGVLFLNLNVLQLVRANDLARHPDNERLLIKEYQVRRGPIVAGEVEIAHSEATEDELKYLRVYEDPQLWAHLTGYYSVVLTTAGIERAEAAAMGGPSTELLAQNLAQLLGEQDTTGDTVRLTVDPNVQRVARQALGDRTGAVVAIAPTTGAILAYYSNPSYDPNLLASHDRGAILDSWEALKADPAGPLRDRAGREVYAPGSTFKLIVAAAALERGLQPTTAFPDEPIYDVPQTASDITNYSKGVCTDGSTISLADALRVSCNTVFARLGVDLGADVLDKQAERFGFDRELPFELPVSVSRFPGDLDVPATAQAALGQRDVRATPLQMAVVAAAIANNGTLMRPHVVAQVQDPSGRTVRGARSGPWSSLSHSEQAVSAQTAQLLAEMMVGVVNQGTGKGAAIPGVRVGGKTGTAQVPDQTSTVWFVGFAGTDVAVAVVLPDAGVDATGGGLAAPIAKAVMEAVLGLR